METTKVQNPDIKLAKKTNNSGHNLYWFSVNGQLTFPAIDVCDDNGQKHYSLWKGNNVKSIIGLAAFKKYLSENTVKHVFGDGSWCYGFEIN